MALFQNKTLLWTLCVLISIFIWLQINTADIPSQLEKLFSISLSDKGSVPKLRIGLLQRLPLGSSKAAVLEFLNSSHVLTGRNYLIDGGDNINFRDYRTVRMPFGILVEYNCLFLLNRDLNLEDIQIRRYLTGP